MALAKFLPETGRWQPAGLTEGAHLSTLAALAPLHHPSDGPPPRAGEDLT